MKTLIIEELLNIYLLEKNDYHSEIIDILFKYSRPQDSELLLEKFFETNNTELLRIISLVGDNSIAEKLLEYLQQNNLLGHKNASELSDFVACLSYMQHPFMEDYLFDLYQLTEDELLELFDDDDSVYGLLDDIAIGLANYKCKGFEDIIKQKIDIFLGLPANYDYAPILAHKLNDTGLVEKLYKYGNSYDRFAVAKGPLIFGIAMYGDIAKPMITNILFDDDHWLPSDEDSLYSNLRYSFNAMNKVGIRVVDIYQKIIDDSKKSEPMIFELISYGELLRAKN
jgi:hypothetical protein